MLGLLFQLRQQVEHVGGSALHHIVKAVDAGVLGGAFHGKLRHVHRRHMLCAAFGRVEGKGAGVGEAVQHRPPLGQPRHRLPVVFLIQKEACFLAVDEVHPIADAVFHDVRPRESRLRLVRQGKPALALRQTLFFPQGGVIAQVDTGNVLPVRPQHLHQNGQQPRLYALHAQAHHLRHQHGAEAIHRQPREAVRLPEDHPTAEQVFRLHHRFAVVPRVLHPPLPEGIVEAVVGVAGEQAAADEGAAVIKGRAEIRALAADHIGQPAVLHGAHKRRHLGGVYPRMSRRQCPLPLWGDAHLRVRSFSLHIRSCLSEKINSL